MEGLEVEVIDLVNSQTLYIACLQSPKFTIGFSVNMLINEQPAKVWPSRNKENCFLFSSENFKIVLFASAELSL